MLSHLSRASRAFSYPPLFLILTLSLALGACEAEEEPPPFNQCIGFACFDTGMSDNNVFPDMPEDEEAPPEDVGDDTPDVPDEDDMSDVVDPPTDMETDADLPEGDMPDVPPEDMSDMADVPDEVDMGDMGDMPDEEDMPDDMPPPEDMDEDMDTDMPPMACEQDNECSHPTTL